MDRTNPANPATRADDPNGVRRNAAARLGGGVGALGAWALARLAGLRYLVAVSLGVLWVGARPATWRRTVREALARQVLFCGVESAPFTCRVAVLVGISVVVQAQLWLRRFGQSQLLGPLLVAVVIRELGPLLANVIVIGRSGNAMAAELGTMTVRGEVRVLDAQGLDPFVYLVVPRVLAMMASVLCLTLLFIATSPFSGYVLGLLLGAGTGGPGRFLDSVTGAIGPLDVLNVIAKSLIPGNLSAVICCTEGLGVGASITELPNAIARAVQRSVVALFFVSSVLSAVTYL